MVGPSSDSITTVVPPSKNLQPAWTIPASSNLPSDIRVILPVSCTGLPCIESVFPPTFTVMLFPMPAVKQVSIASGSRMVCSHDLAPCFRASASRKVLSPELPAPMLSPTSKSTIGPDFSGLTLALSSAYATASDGLGPAGWYSSFRFDQARLAIH